jgi:UDP-glucose 4-epimerase
MKVLITGAGGFIASYLIPELVGDGAQVIGFDIAPKPQALEALGEAVDWERGDLSSSEDLYRLFLRHRPTHVVHLASILAGPCEDNPVRGYKVNFLSTASLLDASLQTGVERFVMTSSISVFGKDAEEPVPDDGPKNPATVYGQTKLACEHLMRWYRDKHSLSVCALRFPWVFGPGRERGITALYSSKLLDSVARKEPLVITNPKEKGDWLYVKDATKALRIALEARSHPQVAYNIMGGVYSIEDVLEMARSYRPQADISYKDAGAAASPYPSSYDDSNARRDLGWAPAYSIGDAVEEHINVVENRIGS